MLLYEKYRPSSLRPAAAPDDYAGVAGQDAALETIATINRTEGMAGQALWITGPSGAGKSTIAELLAATYSDEYATIRINGSDVTVDDIRSWESRAQSRPLNGRTWCIIINECHGLRRPVVTRLLTSLEDRRWQQTVLLIGTTTTAGNALFDESFDAGPFGSRTKPITLTRNVLAPFAARLQAIARAEGMDGQPIGKYERLLKDLRNNLREGIQRVAMGAMKS